MKILVVYDGSINSKDALRCGIAKVRDGRDRLIALNVFNSGAFIGYDSVPGCAETAYSDAMEHLEEAAAIIRTEGKGIRASTILADGDPDEEILNAAIEERADLLLCPAKYKTVKAHFANAIADHTNGRDDMLEVPVKAS